MIDGHDVVTRLREEFDAIFAADAHYDAEATASLVVLRSGEDRHALRVREVASLLAARPVEPVPSDEPAFVGLTSARGRLVPVFDAAALLGGARRDARWLVLIGEDDAVALAFDGFDRYLRVPEASVIAVQASEGGRRFVREATRDELGTVPILDSKALLEELRRLGK